VGASRDIITAMIANLKDHIDDRTVLFEGYRVPPIDLESRTDIPRARIAIYETSEAVTEKGGPEYATLSRQRYGMDISVVRAYNRDDATRGEYPLMDIRDSIVDWASSLDAGFLTDNRIFTFGYDGSVGITRNDKYVTMTLSFSAIRDLSITQT
jgi:hypothetical protein